MNNSRSIARLQIPAQSLPSTPSTIRRPSNLDPLTWSRNPVLLRRPSTESSILPHDPSSLSNLGWGQHLILPPANNTSFVTVTQGYPSPQISPGQFSPERIGGFPYRYQQTIDRTQSNDSGSGTGCSSADSKDYHHHGSILKGRNNGSSTVGTLRRSLSRDAEPRRVVFKNSVSVYWYDSDAESVCSPTEYERFNIEPTADDHRSRYSDVPVHGGQGSPMISDGESGLRRRGGVQRGSSKKRLQETGNARNFPDCTTPRAPPGSPVAQCKQATLPQLVGLPDKRTPLRATPRCSASARSTAQLSLVQDQVTLRRKLVVAVQLSPELHPYDVLVKANKNGNKIRVVVSRNASLGSGSMGYGANEHIPLPVEIDPYQLNARLDRDGILHIEAPVIS